MTDKPSALEELIAAVPPRIRFGNPQGGTALVIYPEEREIIAAIIRKSEEMLQK